MCNTTLEEFLSSIRIADLVVLLAYWFIDLCSNLAFHLKIKTFIDLFWSELAFIFAAKTEI